MSKRRLFRNIAVGLATLLVVLIATVLVLVQTSWFRNYARHEIILLTEDATGGKVDLDSFDFDIWHLTAALTGFVIHGNEPPNAAPFIRVGKVDVEFGLFTSLRRFYEIKSVRIDNPQVNVIELSDGRTNIPSPRPRPASNTSALQTVVDLAIGRFQLTNGLVALDSRKQTLNVTANNVLAQLSYDAIQRSYQGQLSLHPVYVIRGRNTPVNFTITLPVSLQGDRIEIRKGTISTPTSTAALDLALENMRDPKLAGHIGGSISVPDIRNLADVALTTGRPDLPTALSFEIRATVSEQLIQVGELRAGFGRSSIEASGPLKNPAGGGSLAFKAELQLGELTRLFNVATRPEGVVLANGDGVIDASNDYRVKGNIEARNVSFLQNAKRIGGIQLLSAVRADQHTLDLDNVRVTGLGAEFEGNASLQDLEKYKLDGNLRRLDLQTLLRTVGQKLPYDAVISGPVSASGNTKVEGTKSLSGHVALSVSPGRRGVPVTGRLNATYDGAADKITIADSYLALPHTKLTLDGSTRTRLNVSLTSRDLADLTATTGTSSPSPVTFTRGELAFNGAVTGGFTDPRIAGHLAANGFSVEGRAFDSLNADVTASSNRVAISGGNLSRDQMRVQLTAALGLRHWTVPPFEPVTADVSISNADLADIAVMAGQPATGFSGALSANAHVSGTVGNPQGAARLDIATGTLEAQPFDRVHAEVSLTDGEVAIPAAYLQASAGRVSLTAEYRHERDHFTAGRLHAHLQSTPIDLANIRALRERQPTMAGTFQIDSELTGDLNSVPGSSFLLTSVSAQASGRGLKLRGIDYGALNATARTAGQTVAYSLSLGESTFMVRVNGNTQLAANYPTSADASITNLPLDHLLLAADRPDIPARGNLTGEAHLNGPLNNPQGSVDLALSKATLYDEPVDSVRAQLSYLERRIEISRLNVVSGPSTIDLSGRYDHPPGNLREGDARFNVTSSQLDLSRIRNLQKIRPGLAGVIEVNAKGAASVVAGNPGMRLTSLDARLAATNIKLQSRTFGDLTLTANTSNSSQLAFALDSNLGGSSIHGSGSTTLSGDYPANAQLTFSNLRYSRLQPLLGATPNVGTFEASTDGKVTVKGPIFNTSQLSGGLELTRFELNTVPPAGTAKPITISNQGPVVASLDRGLVRIESARMVGPQTDVSASGTASLTGQSLDLTLNANADLGLLPSFDEDIYSSGKIAIAGTVKGNVSQPVVNGQLSLNNAAFNYTGITNGISNANGVVAFNGSNATIRNLTGESGGGKISVSGFAGYSNGIRFGLRANANGVRIRAEQGVSVMAAADIRLTGTTGSSVASGTVTIDQFTYNPQSDLGSILSRAAPPVQSPTAPSPLLNNMKLEVRVRSASGVAVQASLAQNLQADVDLRVGGTASLPAVLGRVTINEGQLVFFGSSYTVDNGTIGFYNPVRIQPILDVSLETQAQGVRVTLRVTGPIDNMNLSYTSDPPLQFQEIVSLLAAGKTPTSDPTLLANQPQTPQQSFQQMGESAIVGKALADPVSSRLERVFGVTQLKIDPSFQAGSQLPTARLTLQQQISTNLTFTYTSALDDPNGQIIRIEWAFSPQYSAIANRDQNGIFSINLFYKRRFR